MKNYFFVVLLFSFFACNQTPSYKVNVNIRGAEGKAFLSQHIRDKWVKLDSVQLQDGRCQFKGIVKNPDVYYLILGNRKEKLPIFVENSVISITGAVDSIYKAKISGSLVHDEYQAFQDKLDLLDKQGTALFNQSKEFEKTGNKIKADSLMVLSEKIFDSVDICQKDYVKANPASYISPYLLSRVYYDMEADVLEGFLSGLDKKLDSLTTVVILKDRVANLKKVAIGQIAPDFTMNDADGKPVKLSDIYSKNNYTLVDFWASWCGPCRHENPNVVAVFIDYKAKGFGVLGVSLDNVKEKWLKAVTDDHLTWPQVSDLKNWKNEAAVLYSVNSIPSNLLVDKTGKIVGRNLREEKLRETIGRLLK